MLLTGDGIFDIQLAHHAALLEHRPARARGTMLRSRASQLGIEVPDEQTSFEPMTRRDARAMLVEAIYFAKEPGRHRPR